MIRVVHYVNQFFGQIGGEDKADIKPQVKDGVVGPGMAFKQAFKGEAEIVATIICGDSYFNENIVKAQEEILQMVKDISPDLFIAGPAFNAGRYGVACGTISKAVEEKLKIPAVCGMYVENPGADMFKKDLYIISTKDNAAGMRDAVPKMANLALKLVKGEEIGLPGDEDYIERGIRKNYFSDIRGSKRAVNMLVDKINSRDIATEYAMPKFDKVDPNPPILDMAKATIALVTSGGIVPKGNPDRIESSSASKFGKYDIEGVLKLTSEKYETAHGGYDPVYANKDPNRVLPVDVLRELEKEGVVGKLYRYFYTTVGNGTSVANSKAYGAKIAGELRNDGVDAVILTST